MGEVAVIVDGRNYPVSCDDGQEEHVTKLAAYLDQRAAELGKQVGHVGESRLLVMTSLMIADELADAYNEIDRLQEEAKSLDKKIRADAEADMETKLVPIVEALAVRIEDIAGHLKTD